MTILEDQLRNTKFENMKKENLSEVHAMCKNEAQEETMVLGSLPKLARRRESDVVWPPAMTDTSQ